MATAFRSTLSSALKIASTAIDSGGHFTHEVYAYCRERKAHNIFAIKGQSQRNKPAIGKATKVDLNWRGKVMRSGAEVYPVGSDTIKSTLFARLKLGQAGAGFVHFHAEANAEYFAQLTAEKQITRYVKGFPVREWVKKSGARNEALDCRVYARAAAWILGADRWSEARWEELERQLAVVTAVTSAARTVVSRVKPAPRRRSVRSSYMG